MRNYIVRSFAVLMLCALATSTALAEKTRKAEMLLATDVTINGTLVKAGKYDFRFNEESGELSLLKKGKVVVKTSARLEARNDKAESNEFRTRTTGNVTELFKVTFAGSNKDVVVSSATVQR